MTNEQIILKIAKEVTGLQYDSVPALIENEGAVTVWEIVDIAMKGKLYCKSPGKCDHVIQICTLLEKYCPMQTEKP